MEPLPAADRRADAARSDRRRLAARSGRGGRRRRLDGRRRYGGARGLARPPIRRDPGSAGWIAELGAAVKTRGAALVDAPVSGSLPAAEAGQLLVLLGGDEAAVETVKEALAPLAAAFRHLGPSGRGARFKLALNHLLGAQIALMAEVLAGLANDGFDEKAAAELLAGSPIVSPAAANYGRQMAAGQHEKLFGVDLMAKDLRYALQVGAAKGVSSPIAEAALGVFERASQSGLGAANVSRVRTLYP